MGAKIVNIFNTLFTDFIIEKLRIIINIMLWIIISLEIIYIIKRRNKNKI